MAYAFRMTMVIMNAYVIMDMVEKIESSNATKDVLPVMVLTNTSVLNVLVAFS